MSSIEKKSKKEKKEKKRPLPEAVGDDAAVKVKKSKSDGKVSL